MRCPKCGFISFDHLTACSKCGRDISEVATELQGTSIQAEVPMFLGSALAAYSEKEETFEEHAMEAEVDEGIDFSMDEEVAMEEAAEEEVIEMAGEEEDIDFSFEEEEEEDVDISLAEAEAEEAAGAADEEEADFTLEEEAEEEMAIEEPEGSFEELDFMGAADEEEDSGLEFDLEDFLEDDEEKADDSGDSDDSDIDLNLDDEEK